MKLKLKVKLIDGQMPFRIIDKGDWIDVRANKDLEITNRGPSTVEIIPLGFATELPKGFEAVLLPRSSTPENFGFIAPNSVGVIDNSYNGNDDEWKMPALAFRKASIKKGDRVAQFRIQLSQKATVWQKLRWLFTSGIKIEYVDKLRDKNRGGFGTTGKS